MIGSTLTIVVTVTLLLFGISFLPDAPPLPDGITSSFNSMIGYITAWGYFIDFKTFFLVLGLTLAVELIILSYKIIMKIIHLVLGVGHTG